MKAKPNGSRSPDKKAGAGHRPDPWELIWGQPYIDANRLARAIEHDLEGAPAADFRTRLLVRDAAKALRSFWGRERFDRWLTAGPTGARIRLILNESLGETGFPFIRRRLVANIGSVEVGQIFDLLGRRIHGRIEVNIAGSIPTLIKGLTARPTGDMDIVNEVPSEVRKQRALLKKIEDEYGLKLTHVRSHYLPANWERRHFLGDYGGLRVYLVDEYDIFVSKLSSAREKHKQDIRVLARVLDKETAQLRLTKYGKTFLDEPAIRARIEENWRFIYQEPLSARASEKDEESGEGGASRKGTPRKRRRE